MSLAVVGSLNLDLVLRVPRLPLPGETLAALDLTRAPGGKGANQAAAAARLGAAVSMIGCVGEDDGGTLLMDALAEVDTSGITRVAEPTGTALVLVTPEGENSIVLAAGANHAWPKDHLKAQRRRLQAARIILAQLETPIVVLEQLLDLAEAAGVPVMLDPAPAAALPEALLRRLTWFTPNQAEASFYAGTEGNSVEPEAAQALAVRLQQLGPRNILLKLGARGAGALTAEGAWCFAPAPRVAVVDTTGAGDVLNAAFAAALLEWNEVPASGSSLGVAEALRFAVAAASLSTLRKGAMGSAPTRAEVSHLLNLHSPGAGK